MKKFICLVVLSFFCGIVFADNPLRLFHIEMNKNPNIVCYDAMLDSNNQINKENPVDSYWVSFTEKNKKREKLNTSDKKIYGFKTKYNEKDNTFDLTLKVIDDKTMTILMTDGKPKVKILINNVEAYLEKIYIQSRENWLGVPSVSFYTLHGLTVNGNEPIEEKVIVK
ncbi:DUF4833 domain-containing protein [Candidatus Ruminimicrobium bovinum]|uniref:DUF4833 domain-containing protein n=1 Tax=Candidatus Ruminimicrobium bovinum TaxID=3242779 RepID=UPI0039B8D379